MLNLNLQIRTKVYIIAFLGEHNYAKHDSEDLKDNMNHSFKWFIIANTSIIRQMDNE